MNVYEHTSPEALSTRSHPWSGSAHDAAHRYTDFRATPAAIRTALEDFRPFEAYPAIETFYRLLEHLNGPSSTLETNDCALNGAGPNGSAQFAKRLVCSGRLMLLFRDLSRNTRPDDMRDLSQEVGLGLSRTAPELGWAAVGVGLMSVRYLGLPGTARRQLGQQLMLSFWAWGDEEVECMGHLDRTFQAMSSVLCARPW